MDGRFNQRFARDLGHLEPGEEIRPAHHANQLAVVRHDRVEPLMLMLVRRLPQVLRHLMTRHRRRQGGHTGARHLAHEDDFQRVDRVLAAQVIAAAAYLLSEDGPLEEQHGEAVRDAHRDQQRQQDVDLVGELEREDDAGERRPHGAAEDRAHADQRPEAGGHRRKDSRLDRAERAAHHQQRREHAA
jgi:hypothetical protein